jgi:PAS domain S-box-containing protein
MVEVMDAALPTGENIDAEYRVSKDNGEWRWMRTRGSARRDASGKILRWYGSVEDIDDHKKMEAALVESEALLKAVFDAVPVGLVIAEAPGGRIVMSNPQAERILGHPVTPAENLANPGNPGAYHPDGSPFEPAEYTLTRAILTASAAGPDEFLYKRPDGTETWISASATPIRNQDGKGLGGVVALLDVDHLKRERESLLCQIAALERQIKVLDKTGQTVVEADFPPAG